MADKPGRMLVQFRKLPVTRQKSKENLHDGDDVFFLELGDGDLFGDVVGRLANKLHVHHTRIRLVLHNCYLNEPSSVFITPREVRIFDLLWTSKKICDVMYYKVLPEPSEQVDEIEAHNRHEKQVVVQLKQTRSRRQMKGTGSRRRGSSKRAIKLHS